MAEPKRLSRTQVREIIDATNCGTCSMCCKILEIKAEPEKNFEYKPWNTRCKHCNVGAWPGGCTRHDDQPEACAVFECVWLQSHRRPDVPGLSPRLKPFSSKVILVQSQENYSVLFAFCDPAYPDAWRKEPMRSHLIGVSETGCTVVIVVKSKRYIMTKGRPTIELEEGKLEELVNYRLQNGKVQVGHKSQDQLVEEALYDVGIPLSNSLNPPDPNAHVPGGIKK